MNKVLIHLDNFNNINHDILLYEYELVEHIKNITNEFIQIETIRDILLLK